ncbi:MAG: succinate dehydrogenase cytochrome b subunit [Flavobacteriales bacterium]|nr:succinate dehydrogenase cytochrome b subunit [Flavobacteriales bacterium]
MANLLKSSIGRKFLMALSALFLIIFLIVHVSVNLISLFSEEAFNEASHFMGTNFFVQFLMQPILFAGVIFHFIMGFVLEYQNKRARGNIRYAVNSSYNATWMSKNMIYSGLVILAFLGLHLFDFWYPTVKAHYCTHEELNYYMELHNKFQEPIRVLIYCISFILLGLHLNHGFQSAFQSSGVNHPKYTPAIKYVGTLYSVIIPMLFIIIAVYHHFN